MLKKEKITLVEKLSASAQCKYNGKFLRRKIVGLKSFKISNSAKLTKNLLEMAVFNSRSGSVPASYNIELKTKSIPPKKFFYPQL